MVNVVKSWSCWPTMIYEFELDIPIHDRMKIITYIKKFDSSSSLIQTDDDIQKISYFKYFKDTIHFRALNPL